MPFDVDYGQSIEDVTVKFKHDAESREELKKEKTADEILTLIHDNNLEWLVDICLLHNTVGFGYFPIRGEFIKINGESYFRPKDLSEMGDIPIETIDDTLFDNLSSNWKQEAYCVLTQQPLGKPTTLVVG